MRAMSSTNANPWLKPPQLSMAAAVCVICQISITANNVHFFDHCSCLHHLPVDLNICIIENMTTAGIAIGVAFGQALGSHPSQHMSSTAVLLCLLSPLASSFAIGTLAAEALSAAQPSCVSLTHCSVSQLHLFVSLRQLAKRCS